MRFEAGKVLNVVYVDADKEIRVARPFTGIDLSGPAVGLERRSALPDWTVAVGLALRDVSARPQSGKGAA